MTAKLKTFHGGSLFVPSPWLAALDTPSHIRQCNVTVLAWSKADVAAMLTDRGLHQVTAAGLAGEMRLARNVSTPHAALTEAGVIDASGPGVYAYRDYVRDRAVIRVEPDGSCTVVAHFRQPLRGGALTVELEG